MHISAGNDNQRRWNQEIELCLRTQRDNVGRMTEDLNKQRILVKSERNKARVTEKVFQQIKQKKVLQRLFTVNEILTVHVKADVDTIRTNYKSLAAKAHLDVGDCKGHCKSIHQA